MLIGQRDLKNIVLPGSIDAEQLQKDEMVEGVTYEDVLADINDGLQLAADVAFSDPLVASTVYVTEESTVEYREGAGNGFKDSTEYGQDDEEHAEEGGHMLPIKKQDKPLGWSKSFLEVAKRLRIDNDISNATDDYSEAIQGRFITRLFKMEAESGKQLGLGATGKSLPLCDAGTCGVTYTPPRGRDGVTFSSSHNHYLRLNGINQANIEAAVFHLWEHKHDAPYDLLIPLADVASWTDKSVVTGFVERGAAYVQAGANDALALVDETYIGVIKTKYGTVRVFMSARVTTGYWNVRRSYGTDDSRNTIYYRVNRKRGKEPWFEVPIARVLPVQGAIIYYEGGFGIGADRTNGVNVKNASSGSYTSPA